MRPSWCPPRIFKTFSWGLFGHPRSLQGGEKVPSWLLRARGRPQNRSTAFLQWIMAPWALPPCKNAVNLAVARGIVNMESIGLAAIYGAPSGDPRTTSKLQKSFSTKPLKLQAFFEWTPDRWTHFPWPLRMASRRPEEASRDDPDHLRMQNSVFSKMLVFLQENSGF